MKKQIRKIEVKIRQIVWVLGMLLKPHTYDYVIYKGNEYFIKSSLTGEDKWSLFNAYSSNPHFTSIKGSDLKVKHSLKRLKTVFKDLYTFQKQSWQLIDTNKPIGRRLCYYNSSNIKF